MYEDAREKNALLAPDISTDTTRPYTAMIPDITTGMRDYDASVQRRIDEHD